MAEQQRLDSGERWEVCRLRPGDRFRGHNPEKTRFGWIEILRIFIDHTGDECVAYKQHRDEGGWQGCRTSVKDWPNLCECCGVTYIGNKDDNVEVPQ